MPRKAKKAGDADAPTFDQKTIQELKEAFSVMDHNKDGIIDKNDLKECYASVGMTASDGQLSDMINEAGGNCNFAAFLSMFGNKLGGGSDSEDAIIAAFEMWDRIKTGKMPEDTFKKILTNKRGEALDDDDLKGMYQGKPPIKDGVLDYIAFAKLMTTGSEEAAEAAAAKHAEKKK